MTRLLSLTIVLLLLGCVNEKTRMEKFRQSCISVAEEYVNNQLDSVKKEVTAGGEIVIGNSTRTYLLDPAKIYPGRINEDADEDAIITLDTYSGQYQTVSEQLILISYEHKPSLSRVLESDMKILSVKDGIITAEVPEHARNSPLFNCHSCREIARFTFLNGDLVRKDD